VLKDLLVKLKVRRGGQEALGLDIGTNSVKKKGGSINYQEEVTIIIH